MYQHATLWYLWAAPYISTTYIAAGAGGAKQYKGGVT
jgi:hypothetical protein